MRENVCPICKEKRGIILDKGRFNLYFCKACENGFINPFPKNISDYYPKMYWQHKGKLSTFRKWLHNWFQKDRSMLLKKFLKKGEILDVGSGEGIFGLMLGNNFIVTNLEYPKAQVINKDVIKVDFLSWKTNKRFDGIVFLESLEHVPYPQKYLEKASSLLKKEGLIFIEYPQFDCLESKILGKFWLQRDIPRHLFHFTKNGLRNIAFRATLQVVTQDGVMSYQYSPYCLLAGFSQALKIPILNLRLGIIKNIPTLLYLFIGAPLAFILEIIFYLIDESPIGLLVLKKK